MSRSFAILLMLVIINAFLMVGCAGIGGTGGTIDETVKPPKNQKLIQGKVTRVSQSEKIIIVGGFQIKPKDGSIIRDFETVEFSYVRAGQIAVVEASDDDEDGVYEGSSISIDEQLTGPVSNIASDSFQISGKIVKVDDFTEFTSGSFATLIENNYVAVFGYLNDDGSFRATLIEKLKDDFSASSDGVKIVGEITDINEETGVVVVDGVEVQLDSDRIKDVEIGDTLVLDNLELNNPESTELSFNAFGPSMASEPKDYEEGLEVVIEGVPSQISERNGFYLNGYQVFITPELLKEKGIESVVERQIIIVGKFVAGRSVLVSDIKLLDTKDFEWRGVLESVSDTSIVVYGMTIYINLNTFANFDLSEVKSDILQNDTEYFVYVRGYEEADGSLIATQVSVRGGEEDRRSRIEGKVESIVDGILVVSGIKVQLSSSVVLANDESVTGAAAILALIAVGDEINVKGEISREGIFSAVSVRVSNLTSSEEEEVKTNGDSEK